MVWWTHRWDTDRWEHVRHVGYKSSKRTGVIWRGKSMWYARRTGPISLFNHILNQQLLMTYFSQPRILPKSPLLADIRMCQPLPAFEGGNTIKFFTYRLKESE